MINYRQEDRATSILRLQCKHEVVPVSEEISHPVIDFVIVADRAEGVNGKLYLMGGAWDRMVWPNLNAPIPFGFAVGVLVPWNRTNEEIPFTVAVEDEDGIKVQPDIHATVNLGRPPSSVLGQPFRAIVAVNGIWKFPKYGGYVIRATIESSEKRVRFFLAPQ